MFIRTRNSKHKPYDGIYVGEKTATKKKTGKRDKNGCIKLLKDWFLAAFFSTMAQKIKRCCATTTEMKNSLMYNRITTTTKRKMFNNNSFWSLFLFFFQLRVWVSDADDARAVLASLYNVLLCISLLYTFFYFDKLWAIAFHAGKILYAIT